MSKVQPGQHCCNWAPLLKGCNWYLDEVPHPDQGMVPCPLNTMKLYGDGPIGSLAGIVWPLADENSTPMPYILSRLLPHLPKRRRRPFLHHRSHPDWTVSPKRICSYHLYTIWERRLGASGSSTLLGPTFLLKALTQNHNRNTSSSLDLQRVASLASSVEIKRTWYRKSMSISRKDIERVDRDFMRDACTKTLHVAEEVRDVAKASTAC